MNWTLLGIAPTKNKKDITAAYRAQLAHANPEDKPEEFKALRAAYEEALALADKTDEEPARDESPVGLWMERVRGLYGDFAARIRPENWQELLADEVCVALDTRPLAEEALLRFLMQEFYIPQTVWQLMDRTFFWAERRGEFYESYPRDFVDYAVMNGIRYPNNLPYELFSPGTSAKDCDEYRRLYYQANQTPPAERDSILEQISALSEGHPYGELLVCQQMMERGEREQALAGYRKLAEDYPQDPRILLEWAAQCMNAEDWTEGERYARRVLELRPDAQQASHMVADALAHQGKYEDAKQLIFRLMDAAGGDQKRIHELRNVIRDWNEELIRGWEEHLKTCPEDMEIRAKLAWCYLQNDRNGDALELCRSIGAEYADRYDYHNLYAKAAYSQGNYEESLPHLEALEDILRTMEPDGTEKTEERRVTLPEKLQMQGNCLINLGKTEEAVRKYEQALELAPGNPEVLTHMGRLLCTVGDKTRAAEMFEKVTHILPGAYHGFYLLGQTLFDLGRDRDAFDAVNRALEQEGGDLGVYVLKMRILLRNGAWEGVRNTLDFLRQHGVTDEIHVVWCEAQLLEYGENNKEKALDLYHTLAERVEGGEPLEEAAALYFRILVLEGEKLDARKAEDRAHMLELADKGLAHDGDDAACLDYKAWLLKRDGRLDEALELYLRLEKKPRRTLNVEEEIAEIYYDDLDRNAAEALRYYNLLIENDEKPVFHFYAGTCCKYLEDYEGAERHFLRVQEMNPDGVDGYNGMSYLYDTMGRHEESLEQINEVIRRIQNREGDQSKYYYHKLRILRRLNRPQDALAVLDELFDRYGDADVFREKFDVCCQFGLWDQAESVLKAWRKNGKKKERLMAAEIDLKLFRGQVTRARMALNPMFGKVTSADAERLKLLLAELDGDESVQMDIWKKRAEKRENRTHELMNMAQVQRWNGHDEKAREYAQAALEQIEELIPRNKKLEALYRGRRAIVLALLGRIDEARAELETVRKLPLCETCNYCACKDADIFEANIEEVCGNWEKAAQLHRAGMERWPDDLDFASGARRMKRKGF